MTEYGTSTALISAGCFHFALKASLCTSTPSALPYGKLSFANCGFQTSWPMAFWLGRANRRPWDKIGGETKGENRMRLPLSASGDISGSDSTSLWLLPETPLHLWSDTSQAAPPLSQLLWRSPCLDHTCSPCPSWPQSGRSFLHLLNSGCLIVPLVASTAFLAPCKLSFKLNFSCLVTGYGFDFLVGFCLTQHILKYNRARAFGKNRSFSLETASLS